MTLSRRAAVAGGLALAACKAKSAPALVISVPPLRSVATFPIGTCVQSGLLDDPAYATLLAAQVSQLTPEWELKMEYVVRDDGSLRFDAPDKIAAFARAHGQRLFGHTLVWYAQSPPAFMNLQGARFAQAFDAYIAAVVSRYRGQAVAWDVVNEAITDDGTGWRASLWADRLGPFDHMVRAFHGARAADPNAVLLLNDYNLEYLPKKRAAFLKLAEALLKAGAPLTGLGTQTHLAVDLPPGAIKAAIEDLASLGLPIHLSELDISLTQGRRSLMNVTEREVRQTVLYAEAAEAFSALPARQRFAFTLWGLRDADSWLIKTDANDRPCLFDGEGKPHPTLSAVERAFGA